jgi:hypothetical protein
MTAIRDRLRAIPGVEDVVTTADGAYWLMISPDEQRSEIESAARSILIDSGAAPGQGLELVVRANAANSARVRFDGIERREERDNHVRIIVALEWNGETYRGEATGERGGPIETRTAAAASLAAINKTLEAPLGLRLIGVKQVRAFDAEMMVVSLFRQEQQQKLVGIVVTGEDPRRAAALAVLNALNRALGSGRYRGT